MRKWLTLQYNDAKFTLMDTRDLDLLQLVAQLGSYAAAARHLDRDASVVSRAIAGLEADLGFRLFQRTTRQMALTEAGALFLARLAPVSEELARAREEASALASEPAGRLRMSASVAFGQAKLVPLLSVFRTQFPKLALDLVLTDRPVDLVAERVDMAIRLGPSVANDLIVTKLVDTSYKVVASPRWAAEHGPLATPEQLGGHDCLLLDLPDFWNGWRFQEMGGAPQTVAVTGDIKISSVLALKAAAIEGLGPTLLADWLVADALESGDLVDLFPQYRTAATDFETAAWIVYPSRSFVPRKVRVMIDFLKANAGVQKKARVPERPRG